MGIFNSIDISASALTAERVRMDIISNNIANVNTTRTENGQPYRRKMPIFQERSSSFKNILNKQLGLGEKCKGIRIKDDMSPLG